MPRRALEEECAGQAREAWESLGELEGDPKVYTGFGKSRTVGRRRLPWSVVMSNGHYLGGTLSSNEMKNSKDLPLLLSLAAPRWV